MNLLSLIFIWSLVASTPDTESPFLRAVPAEDNANLFGSFRSDEESACKAVYEDVSDGDQDPFVYLALAYCANKPSKVQAEGRSVLAELPQGSPLVLFVQGEISQFAGDFKGAETLFRQVVALEPSFAMAWSRLALALLSQGDPVSALPLQEKALALVPELEMARYGLASAYVELGDYHLRNSNNEDALSFYQRADAAFQAVGDSLQRVRSLHGIANVRLRQGQQDTDRNADADKALENARHILSTTEDRLAVARIIAKEADILYSAGQSHRAIGVYEEAAELFRSITSFAGLGKALVDVSEVYLLVGQPEVALEKLQEARLALDEAGDKQAFANLYESEARIHTFLGDYKEALADLLGARLIYGQFGESQGLGNVLKGEGDLFFKLGDYKGAHSKYLEAREHSTRAGDQLGIGNTYRGEGGVLSRMGRYEAARSAYRKAQEMYRSIGFRMNEANALAREGEVLLAIGETGLGLSVTQTAHEIFHEVGSPLGQGNTALNMARGFLVLNDDERAMMLYKVAARRFREAQSTLDEWNAEVGYADVIGRNDRAEEALEIYQDARDYYKRTAERFGEASSYLGAADVYYRLGKHKLAATDSAVAARLFSQVGSTAGRLNSLVLRTHALYRLGEFREALRAAELAIGYQHDFRREFLSDTHRTVADRPMMGVYDVVVSILAASPETAHRALAYVEESRSRVLLDLLVGKVALHSESSEDSAQRTRDLQAQLAQVSEEFRHAIDPGRREDLRLTRGLLDAELSRQHYLQLSVTAESQSFGDALGIEAMRDLAARIGPMLIFFSASEQLFTFVVHPSGRIATNAVEVSRSELSQSIDDFLFNVTNPLLQERSRGQAEAFWRLLISPSLEDLIPDGPLTIVPHGPLHKLPFEALQDPETGRRLFEFWDTATTPSVSTLAFILEQSRAIPDGEFVAFASGEGLSLTEVDIRKVSSVFPGAGSRVFSSEDSTFSSYRDSGARGRHLLIATRGVHVQDSRRGTYLEITPTPGVHDERLTAAEIATIPLSAELVTLAACDTDRGDALLSDERLTLTRSFLIAGAASVLATRWQIPEDRRTARFLVDFYEAYVRGGPDGKPLRKDEALTVARRKGVKRGDPAQVWAAWVLVGDAQ